MKILWLDNDRSMLMPHQIALESVGYDVCRVHSVTEAENNLHDGTKWALVMIDVMLNISENEERFYPPSITDAGHSAGLLFFSRNQDYIYEIGSQVCVFSIRDEYNILSEFIKRGLNKEHYGNKLKYSDTRDFLDWVNKIVGRKK